MVAAHYTKVTKDMQDAKMTANSEDKLRELASGAGIHHGRITEMQTLCKRLAQHFAELLPERDDA